MKRLCLMCGAVDVSPRGAQTMFCLDCGPKASRRNGAYEAHKAVALAVRKGLLPKAKTQQCVDCGRQAHGYDHRDYNKPLDVEPVCQSCNKLRGPAIPLGGMGLFTSKQARFVRPNWTAPAKEASHV